MDKPVISFLSEIQKEFGEIKNANETHKAGLKRLDRLALFVTEHIGTMGFFLIVLAWTICWLSWNIFAPPIKRFDPFPGFVLWLFISNLIQLFLMPLIMIGQNIQGKHAELRSEYDYRTNKKAEKEIEVVLLRLEKQENLLEEILKSVQK